MQIQTELKSDLAVVLVHGIGDITPGSVLDSASQAVGEHLGIEAVSPPSPLPLDCPKGTGGVASVRKAEFERDGQQIDLVEFNWTSVTGKIRLRRPIDAIVKLLGVLRDVPALGYIGRASQSDRLFLAVSSWLYQAAFLVCLLTSAVTVFHELARHKDYANALVEFSREDRPSAASAEEAAEWGYRQGVVTLRVFDEQQSRFPAVVARVLGITLLLLSGWTVVLLLYTLIRLVNGLFIRRAMLLLVASGIGWFLTFIATLLAIVAGIFSFQLGLGLLNPSTELIERVGVTAFSFALLLWLPAMVVAAIGNLLRDVVHYLAPDRAGSPTPDQRAIREQLGSLLEQLRKENRYATIIVTSHSLGSLIVLDLLRELAQTDSGPPQSTDVVTAGSPLRRLILRFLPDLSPSLRELRSQLAKGQGYPVARWFNVYRVADYVGQALTRSALPLDLVGRRWNRGDAEDGIKEYLLTPRYHWPFAHANYWRDARFVRFMALTVIKPLLEPRSGELAKRST